MFIIENYSLAVLFCFITMLCWGSWGNTLKLATKTWRFELFYWDYVIGVLLFSLFSALTLGSIGSQGRSFIPDLMQADFSNVSSAFIGGVIFNLSNILLSAAIAISGMAVAFPLGVGLALVLGVVINYISTPKGDPVVLFVGVALITIAILLNAKAYKNMGSNSSSTTKGIVIAVVAGILMSVFYRFIAASMDVDNFANPQMGKMTPYTAVFIFSVGMFVSNFIINTVVMRKPFVGLPVSYKDYFNGNFKTHLIGVFGGAVWGLGNSLNLIAAGKAGAAISYGLGQGATMIAALWGVFIWKEFKGGPKVNNIYLTMMFVLFFIGIGLIIYAGT
ncbi:GRP family sugar transporter [Pedobacter nyackensis]|uniref:Glucose uptake protein n=1 Tax=Pedobacter nyackensis TaxID=475255 RepID=A0A1W2D2E2_9SPHI|nr:GRP family sugar transporter [Pedobacter nyackensis]SMC91242.1 glucose uptake protein [Pedobacter nyackensis]